MTAFDKLKFVGHFTNRQVAIGNRQYSTSLDRFKSSVTSSFQPPLASVNLLPTVQM